MSFLQNLIHLAAATSNVPDSVKSTVKTLPDATKGTFLTNALNLAYFAAGIACAVMIIVSGINWIVSSGQPDKVKKAQQTLTYAVVGLIIIFAAFAITRFVLGAAG